MTELVALIIVLGIWAFRKILKSTEPGLPAFKDYEASLRHTRDMNEHGAEYAERKWKNGDYS